MGQGQGHGLGFWIHLDEAYVTYHQSYVESVWWSLKRLFDRGLLYQGLKIVWWWAQGGTALSAGEVGQGYRQVADPSVFVRFPLVDDPDTSLLVWTTTPWTLPSNQFAAVNPDLEYATVRDVETGDRLIMASALVETIADKSKREVASALLPARSRLSFALLSHIHLHARSQQTFAEKPVDVFGIGGMSHQSDPPDLRGEWSETGSYLYKKLLSQSLSYLCLVTPVWACHGIQHR